MTGTKKRAAALAQPGAFADENADRALRDRIGLSRQPDELGARSRTVGRRIASSCAGWPEPPTTHEFRAAIESEAPDVRQQSIISMWVMEATWRETLLAWAEEAYSWRELAGAIHRAGAENDNPERNAELNELTTR